MSNKLLTDTYKKVKNVTRSQNDVRIKNEICKDEAGSCSRKAEVDEMNILKQFDLSWKYGPCTGITRLERWKRAEKHGLNPPEEVKDIIFLHPDDETYTKCLWKDYDL